MNISFSIRIIDKYGNPLVYEDVIASENTLLFKEESKDTNSDGWVKFNWETAFENYYDISVFVRRKNIGRHSFSDGDSASFVYTE